MQYRTESREQTQSLGQSLAATLAPGDVIALEGGLGSGKTELVRGVMHALNPRAVVRSPSFSLVNSYETPGFMVHHFDFYRLHGADDLFELGFDEYVNPSSVCFIEWAQVCQGALPQQIQTITFVDAHGDSRVIETEIEISL